MKAIVGNLIYLPKKHVKVSKLDEMFSKPVFDDQICNSMGYNNTACKYKKQRLCEHCLECEGYLGDFDLYRTKAKVPYRGIKKKTIKQFNKKNLIALPLGRDDLVYGIVKKDFDVIDVRTENSFDHSLEFTGKLSDQQAKTIRKVLKRTRGLLKAPPRSGKTVMSVALACQLKMKTLIVAHKNLLLNQFLDTIEKHTNYKDITHKDRPAVLIAKKPEDHFKGADIVLTTYQQYIKDKQKTENIAGLYGLVIIDEVHKGNANAYSRFLTELSPKRMYGLTATPKRKDGMDFIVDHIIGPIRYDMEGKVETLSPIVKARRSAHDLENKHSGRMAYTNVLTSLCRQKENPLTGEIVAQAMKDLEAGYDILIMSMRVKYTLKLCSLISRAWAKQSIDQEPIAVPLVGGTTKKELYLQEQNLNAVRSRKARVLVGTRSMTQDGLNVPNLSMLYEIHPISNTSNFEQESKRICTMTDTMNRKVEKNHPVIRFFLPQGCRFTDRCFVNCMRDCHRFGYKLHKSAIKMLKEIKNG